MNLLGLVINMLILPGVREVVKASPSKGGVAGGWVGQQRALRLAIMFLVGRITMSVTYALFHSEGPGHERLISRLKKIRWRLKEIKIYNVYIEHPLSMNLPAPLACELGV